MNSLKTPGFARPSRILLLTVGLACSSLVVGCDRKDGAADESSDKEVAAASEVTENTAETELPEFDGKVESVYQIEAKAGYDEPSMAVFGEACLAGQVPAEPQHTFTVASPTHMELVARGGEEDTTLVVEGPGGPYCNDDFDGLDAGMRLKLQPGDYSAYVGTYSDQPIDPTPSYTFVIKNPRDAEPRNPVLMLLDQRLDELIETAGPAKKKQFERLQVLINSLSSPVQGPLKMDNVEQLKEVLSAVNVGPEQRSEFDALLERLEKQSQHLNSRKSKSPSKAGVEKATSGSPRQELEQGAAEGEKP